jgi:hypothetical protein
VRTDDKGRLLILGGRGHSDTLIPDNRIGFLNTDSYFANNDYWYDDTSDGPVSASVVLKSGRAVDVVDKAWVLVAPPKYAPADRVLTTLYEVARETWEKKLSTELVPREVSFTRHYPVLERWSSITRLTRRLPGHGLGRANTLRAIPGCSSRCPRAARPERRCTCSRAGASLINCGADVGRATRRNRCTPLRVHARKGDWRR